jgi:glycosyltransferase involved in cell wall biosynthesis
MILVVEPIFPNAHHAAVNAANLRAILTAADGERVVFAAHPAHLKAVFEVNQVADDGNLDSIELAVPPPGGVSLRRFVFQARALVSLARRHGARVVICLGTAPETLFACRVLALAVRNVRIFAVLHGNLDQAATGWRSRDPRRRWFDDRSSLAVAVHPSIWFVVLEHSIARAAIAKGLVPQNRCIVWPLPINEGELRSVPCLPDPQRVRIAFLGSAKRSKGFGDFLDLSRHVMASSDRYEFSLIGGLYDRFPAEDLAHIAPPPGFLDRDAFLERLHAVDYVCLPLKGETYTLSASGALIDAIAALKPIIALPTPAVLDLFQNGPVGLMCDDMRSMIEIVSDTDRLCDPVAYAAFQQNLAREQARRVPSVLAEVVAQALA